MKRLEALARRKSVSSAFFLILTVLGAAIVPIFVSAEPAETRRQSSVYLAGDGATVNCGSLQGGACFSLRGDEFEASIGVADDLGRPPASARYEFRTGTTVTESGSFCDSTKVPVPTGSTRLLVMVAASDPLGCSEPAVGSTGKITVVTKISEGEFERFDVEPQVCLQLVPEAASVAGVTEPEDQGQEVLLDVLVLLDGVTEETGRPVMEKSAEAFAPLGIKMLFEYRQVQFSSGTGNIQLSNTAAAVGGKVPPGFDIVHTLTSKTLNVGGQADCIGGVRYRDRAFSVSRILEDRKIIYVGGPAPIEGRMINNYSAKIAAHEIGHTMGGHHHYGNCVEAASFDPQSCTVMLDPSPFPKELVFGAVNGAVIRAHAARYARSGFGWVAGVVTDGHTGEPVKGMRVEVTAGPTSGAVATTDSEGRYLVPRVAAGEGYALTAGGEGYLSKSQEGVKVVEAAETVVDFDLNRQAASIDVSVSRNGRPYSGADVIGTHFDLGVSSSCTTGTNGTCSLSVLWGEGYTVTARINPSPQGSAAKTSVVAPGQVSFLFGPR